MENNGSMAAINWYPGHMAKARRQMEERLGLVDMVIEVRDARIPLSSANPMLTQLTAAKPHLIILAKADKAEPDVTAAWLATLAGPSTMGLGMDLLHDKVPTILDRACRDLNAARIARQQAKGVKNVLIRALVCGIPNVGKSTLINQAARRRLARTSDRPGVTQALQWVRVSPDVALLDTPGVLWPKFEDPQVGYRLALTGAIADDVLPLEQVARFGLDMMVRRHPERLVRRYGLKPEELSDPWRPIGMARGCLTNDGRLDEGRLATLIVREARDGQWGRISWEVPDADPQ